MGFALPTGPKVPSIGRGSVLMSLNPPICSTNPGSAPPVYGRGRGMIGLSMPTSPTSPGSAALGYGRGRGMIGLSMPTSPTSPGSAPLGYGRGRGMLGLSMPTSPTSPVFAHVSTGPVPVMLPTAPPRATPKYRGRRLFSSRRARTFYPIVYQCRPEDFERIAFASCMNAMNNYQVGLQGCTNVQFDRIPEVLHVSFYPRRGGRTPRLQFWQQSGH